MVGSLLCGVEEAVLRLNVVSALSRGGRARVSAKPRLQRHPWTCRFSTSCQQPDVLLFSHQVFPTRAPFTVYGVHQIDSHCTLTLVPMFALCPATVIQDPYYKSFERTKLDPQKYCIHHSDHSTYTTFGENPVVDVLNRRPGQTRRLLVAGPQKTSKNTSGFTEHRRKCTPAVSLCSRQ